MPKFQTETLQNGLHGLSATCASLLLLWSRKATVDRTKFMRASIGFSLALGLVLAGIPWFRMGAV